MINIKMYRNAWWAAYAWWAAIGTVIINGAYDDVILRQRHVRCFEKIICFDNVNWIDLNYFNVTTSKLSEMLDLLFPHLFIIGNISLRVTPSLWGSRCRCKGHTVAARFTPSLWGSRRRCEDHAVALMITTSLWGLRRRCEGTLSLWGSNRRCEGQTVAVRVISSIFDLPSHLYR